MRKYLLKVALDHFAFGLTIPIGVVWQLSRGVNIEQVAIVAAIMTGVTLLADIPLGALADKYGRKPSLVLGSATLGLSSVVLATSQSFAMFCVYGVLSGIGWALLSGAEEAYVFETSEAEGRTYRSALGDVTIVDEIATILGLAGAAIITKYFGLQEAIFAAAALLALATLAALIVLSEPAKHSTNIGEAEKKSVINAVQFLKKHSHYLIIMLIFAIYYEGGRFMWQPQLVDNGVKIYQLGLLFAFFKVFSIGGSFFAKKFTLSAFKLPMLLAGAALSLTFIMMSSSILAIIIIGFCVYSFIENYTRVLQSDYLNKAVKSHRASFLSLNNIVRNGYSAAITPILGVVALSHLFRGFIFLAVIQIMATITLGIFVHESATQSRHAAAQ